MPLITLVVYLVLIGVVLYLVEMIPMDATILLWLITMFLPLGPVIPLRH